MPSYPGIPSASPAAIFLVALEGVERLSALLTRLALGRARLAIAMDGLHERGYALPAAFVAAIFLHWMPAFVAATTPRAYLVGKVLQPHFLRLQAASRASSAAKRSAAAWALPRSA